MVNTLESVSIRRAIEQDLGALAEVQALSMSGAGVSAPPADWRVTLADTGRFIYLAEDESPFGFVSAGQPIEPISTVDHMGEILGWYLKPSYWHYGMGRKLLVRGLSVLKRRHFDHAFLWIPDASQRAVDVASSVGFETAGATRTTNLPDGDLRETAYRISLLEFF